MERREFLKAAGVAGGAGAAGVASIFAYDRLREDPEPNDSDDSVPTPPDAPPSYVEFDTVVDAVGVGADPDGDEPINDLISAYADDDTLLSFRSGTYRLHPHSLSGVTHFGIAAAQAERPTFVPSVSECRPREPYLTFEDVDDLLLSGLDFDFRGAGPGMTVELYPGGDTTVRNVRMVGSCPKQLAMLRVDVRDADGTALLEEFVAENADGSETLTGVYVGKDHAGEVTFRDCTLRGFPDNGLYASSPGHPGGENGVVRILDGTFSDNNISNVRLGTTDSVARGATVTVESPPSLDGKLNARGIRLREKSGQTVEGCDVYLGEDVARSFGGIVFHPDAGEAYIRNTTVRVDADAVPGVNALPPAEQDVSGPLLEGVRIVGDATSGYAATVDGRDDTVFRNCTIDQDGSDRGGIRLRNAEACRIVDSDITTTGPPIELDDADVSVENTTITTPDGTRSIESLTARNEVVTP